MRTITSSRQIGHHISTVALSVIAFCAARAWAVNIPYSDTPAAVIGNAGGMLWDDQLAQDISFDQSEYDLSPQIIFVADFCYSGGFVDDLMNQTNTTFAATAANWDETSTSAPTSPFTITLPFHYTLTIPGVYIQNSDVLPFGQTFMTRAQTQDLGDSFAAASAAVANNQTALEGVVGNSASQTLQYNAGDRAIIFSAGDANNPGLQTSFEGDVQTTYNSLLARGWAAGAINTVWDQGQNIPAQGANVAVPVQNASTIQNLEDAINAVYQNPAGLTDNSKVFIYMNDHGTSTDQVLDKVAPNGNGTFKYTYQVTVSNYRINSPDSSSDYGVSQIQIGSGVPEDAIVAMSQNTGNLPAGWSISVNADGDLIITTNAPTTAASWLQAGTAYTFSFNSPYPATKDNWLTLESTLSDEDGGVSDLGVDSGSAWGASLSTYNANSPSFTIDSDGVPINFYNDPSQVMGWDNGGNGWVEAPMVPEPASVAALLAIGAAGLMRRSRRSA